MSDKVVGYKQLILAGIAAVAVMGGGPASAAQDTSGYLVHGEGVVKDNYGECVLNAYRQRDFYQQCETKVAAPEPMPAPAPAPAPMKVEKLTLQSDAYFDFDKAKLKPAAKTRLDELWGRVKGAVINAVKIVGHTDSIGTEAYNQKLSERRAESVKSYLVDKGVSADLIEAKGMGESQPMASNQTKEGRAKNRRVEVEIDAQGK